MAEKNMYSEKKAEESTAEVDSHSAEILPEQSITDKDGQPVEGFFFRGFLAGTGVGKDRDGNDEPFIIVYGNGASPKIRGIDMSGLPRFSPVFVRVNVRAYNGNTYLSAVGGDK